MIGNKERTAGSAIAALCLSKFIFKELVRSGRIKRHDAEDILVKAAADCSAGDGAQKYAWHLFAKLRDWLDKQPDR